MSACTVYVQASKRPQCPGTPRNPALSVSSPPPPSHMQNNPEWAELHIAPVFSAATIQSLMEHALCVSRYLPYDMLCKLHACLCFVWFLLLQTTCTWLRHSPDHDGILHDAGCCWCVPCSVCQHFQGTAPTGITSAIERVQWVLVNTNIANNDTSSWSQKLVSLNLTPYWLTQWYC